MSLQDHSAKLRSAILVGCILSSFVLTALTAPALGQTTSSNQTTPQSGDIAAAIASEELKPGIVVERVEKNSEGERAGLKEGDVLLAWSRDEAKGRFESPFDVLSVQIEQRPFGEIALEGVRRDEKHIWKLGWDSWGIETTPKLPASILATYLQGNKLAKAGNLPEAVEHWRVAANQARKSSPQWLSTWLLLHSARQLADTKRWNEADQAYREAVQDATESPPVVRILISRLWGEMFLWRDWAAAEKHYQQALTESEELDEDNLFTAKCLNSLGQVAYHSIRYSQAREYFNRALAIDRKVSPGSLAVASDLNYLGFIAAQLGDLQQEADYSQQALSIQERLAPDSYSAANSLSYLGSVAAEWGDLTKSEAYLHRELAIREKLGGLGSAPSVTSLGVLAHNRGDLSRAEAYYRQALALRQKLTPDNPVAVPDILNRLGQVAMDRGDVLTAERLVSQAVTSLRKHDQEGMYLSWAVASLGTLAERRLQWARAEKYYSQVLDIQKKRARDGIEVARALNHLGDIARHRHELSRAEEYYNEALTIFEKQASESVGREDSLAALAGILHDKHENQAAAQLYEQALSILQTLTTRRSDSEDIRAGFRAKYAGYYQDYISLLITQKQPQRAFEMLEKLHARTMLETLVQAHADIRKGVDTTLVEKERSLQDSIGAKSSRRMQLIGDNNKDEQIKAFDKEINELLSQYKDVEEQIRETSPSYAALTQPRPLTAKEAQEQLLDANTLLLEYSLGEGRSYVFAVTPDSLNAYALPKRAEIERVAHHVYELLTERNRKAKGESEQQRKFRQAKAEAEYAQAVGELSHMVLGPVAGQLFNKRLLIVSDGALQYIPFAVLSLPQAPLSKLTIPLVAEHEIVNLPSASVLAVLRREQMQRKQASKMVAVLADPVFVPKDERVTLATNNGPATRPNAGEGHPSASQPDPLGLEAPEESDLDRSAKQLGVSGFSRLPFTRREADAINSIAGKNAALEALDFDASKATALSAQLKDYRIVHFATHGLLNNEHPELSGLVFSLVDKQGNSQDGFLRMLDIYNMDLNADLVVLSACQTALGKEIGEEGLIGLTRGFMYAGAPRVVASLWKVDDEATAELMKKFYQGMLRDHQTPAQALRSAQQWMRTQNQWQSPYYWAGFVLQGDWK